MKKFFKKIRHFSNVFSNAFFRRFGVAIASIIIGLIISFFQSQANALTIEWNDTDYELPDIPIGFNTYNIILRSTNTSSGIAYLKSLESIDGAYYDTTLNKFFYGSINTGLQCSCNYFNGDTSWGTASSISSSAIGMNNVTILWSDFDVLDQNGNVLHTSDAQIDKGLPLTVTIYSQDYLLYSDYITKNYDYWFIVENQYVHSTSNAGRVGQRISIYCSNDREMLVNIYDSSSSNDSNGNIGNLSVKLENNKNENYNLDEYSYEYSTLLDYRYDYTVACMNFSAINFTPDDLHYGENNIVQVVDNEILFADQNRYPFRTRGTAPTQFTHILASNYDVKDYNGNIIYYNSSRKPPELSTPIQNLEDLDFDYLSIDSWGYSDTDFYMLIYDRTYTGVDPEFATVPQREILLNKNSSYYKQLLSVDPTKNCVYWVPLEEMGIQFSLNGAYEIRFGLRNYYSSDGSFGGGGDGGGFRDTYVENGRSYYYEFIGDSYSWTLNPTLAQSFIDSINNRITLTNEQRQHYDTVKSINDINFFMRNGTVGDGVVSLPTLTVPDSTFGFFDNLFVGLRDSFTNFNDNPISFSLMGHTYNIYPSNFYLPNNDIFNALRNILSVFWYIQIYLYVLKNVYSIARATESGSFSGGIEGSVKADLV